MFVCVQDGGEGVQVVPPETLQGYIQQLISQTLNYVATGSGEGEGDAAEASAGANTVQVWYLCGLCGEGEDETVDVILIV